MNKSLNIPDRFLKILVLFCAYVFLGIQLYRFDHWDEIHLLNANLSGIQFFFFFLVILLMPFNWLLEILKWQFLISPITKISFKKASQSVYFGLAAGLATPGKVGDWPGRAMAFPKEQRHSIGASAVFNSLIKTLSLSVAGILSWFVYALIQTEDTFLASTQMIIPALCCVLILLVVFLFSRRFVTILLTLIRRKEKDILDVDLSWITIQYRLNAFLISLTRILIFSFQFILLAKFFLGDQFSGTMLLLPPVYFFIITFIPAFSISDPGIRGSVALILFGGGGLSTPFMAVTGILLWVINTIVPFLIGQVIFGMKVK